MTNYQEIFETLVDELDLNHGNGGFEDIDEEGNFIGYIEAPNNTTLTIYVNFGIYQEITEEEIKAEFVYYIKEAIENFDPEETFEELWHPNFEIGAFRFVEMLKEDEQFFQDKKNEL